VGSTAAELQRGQREHQCVMDDSSGRVEAAWAHRVDDEVARSGLHGDVLRPRRGCGDRRRCPRGPTAGGGEGEVRADGKKKGAGNRSHRRGKKRRRRLHRMIPTRGWGRWLPSWTIGHGGGAREGGMRSWYQYKREAHDVLRVEAEMGKKEGPGARHDVLEKRGKGGGGGSVTPHGGEGGSGAGWAMTTV
jgi:hypothetical protein